MLKTKQKASSRRAQRLKPGPFSLNKSSTKNAQVQFNRIGQQLKKKLRHGSAIDIIDSMKSEIGWVGLCILFACLISVCYIILMIIYSGNNQETPVNLHRNDINSHLNNDGSSIEHALNIDPEHWPHHLSKDNINKNAQTQSEKNINDERELHQRNKHPRRDRNRDRNPDRDAERDDRDARRDAGRDRKRGRDARRDRDAEMDDSEPRRERRNARRDAGRDRKRGRDSRRDRNRDAEMDTDANTDSDRAPETDMEQQQLQVDSDQASPPADGNAQIEAEDAVVETDSEMNNWNKIWNIILANSDNDNDKTDVIEFTEDELDEKSHRIKNAFLFAWHGYAKYALGHDEIHPVSDLPGDSWGGLGATLIDALDTMMLMGIKEEYKQARNKLNEIDFSIDLKVSFFETIIRHLGGLLSAYEMSILLAPADEFILSQAIALGEHLLPAFDTEKGIPKSMVNLKTKEIKNYAWTKDRSILSEIGSNQLEFTILSKYSNDSKYFRKSYNVFKLLDIEQSNNENNGLFPQLINTNDATFPKNEKVYSLGGMSDSFYETTLKQWILTGYKDKLSIKLYMNAITAANEKLLRVVFDKNRREKPYFFYGEQWYNKFRGKMEELECFMPGVLALGYYHANIIESKFEINELTQYEKQLINNKNKHLKLAESLADSCYALYSEMETGLAPESIEFNDDSWNPKEQKYQLRPETLESLYILYTLTGNNKYRIWAWNIFESIEKYCKTDVAYSGIIDVRNIPPKQDNQMQSYVMAETFKYLFLMFDTYARELLPLDKYVFNTEAHPIRIINDIEKFEWYQNDLQ